MHVCVHVCVEDHRKEIVNNLILLKKLNEIVIQFSKNVSNIGNKYNKICICLLISFSFLIKIRLLDLPFFSMIFDTHKYAS